MSVDMPMRKVVSMPFANLCVDDDRVVVVSYQCSTSCTHYGCPSQRVKVAYAVWWVESILKYMCVGTGTGNRVYYAVQLLHV